MKRQFGFMVAALAFATGASAATIYTSLDDTPVLDKPSLLGSNVTAHLPAGSMVETLKVVGPYTNVSYIVDGKVKNGFIATAKIANKAGATGVADQDAAVGDLDGDVSQALSDKVADTTDTTATTAATGAANEVSTKASVYSLPDLLGHVQVTDKDLSTFAKSGQLFARKVKSKTAVQ